MERKSKKWKKKENKQFPYKKGGRNRVKNALVFDEFGNIDEIKTEELNRKLNKRR